MVFVNSWKALPQKQNMLSLIKSNGSPTTSYPLSQSVMLGRAPGCDFHIDSPSVSWHHAKITVDENRDAFLHRVSAQGEVRLNGEKWDRAVLRDLSCPASPSIDIVHSATPTQQGETTPLVPSASVQLFDGDKIEIGGRTFLYTCQYEVKRVSSASMTPSVCPPHTCPAPSTVCCVSVGVTGECLGKCLGPWVDGSGVRVRVRMAGDWLRVF